MNRTKAPLLVIGGGGHAKVVIATARAAGYLVVGAWDDDPRRQGSEVLGVPVHGPIAALAERHEPGVLAIGDNRTRARIASSLALEWATIIHPSAVIAEGAKIGPGSVVLAGAVIQPDAHLAEHVIVNTAASIDHDCRIADYCHLAPGSRLGGGVSLEVGVLFGVGSCAVPGARVGAWSVVGAGGAVVHDLPAGVIAVGVPARVRRELAT